MNDVSTGDCFKWKPIGIPFHYCDSMGGCYYLKRDRCPYCGHIITWSFYDKVFHADESHCLYQCHKHPNRLPFLIDAIRRAGPWIKDNWRLSNIQDHIDYLHEMERELAALQLEN